MIELVIELWWAWLGALLLVGFLGELFGALGDWWQEYKARRAETHQDYRRKLGY